MLEKKNHRKKAYFAVLFILSILGKTEVYLDIVMPCRPTTNLKVAASKRQQYCSHLPRTSRGKALARASSCTTWSQILKRLLAILKPG
jgi:hypothetical protein